MEVGSDEMVDVKVRHLLLFGAVSNISVPGLLLTALTPASWVATLRSLDPRGLRPFSLLVSVSYHPTLKLDLLRLPFI